MSDQQQQTNKKKKHKIAIKLTADEPGSYSSSKQLTQVGQLLLLLPSLPAPASSRPNTALRPEVELAVCHQTTSLQGRQLSSSIKQMNTTLQRPWKLSHDSFNQSSWKQSFLHIKRQCLQIRHLKIKKGWMCLRVRDRRFTELHYKLTPFYWSQNSLGFQLHQSLKYTD